MSARVFLAGLYHETHGFVDDITELAHFRRRRGDALLARRGDGSVIDGLLSVAQAEGWTVLPGPDWGATPSGPVDHAAFEAYLDEFEAAFRAAGPVDAILLGLHGAMTTTREEDAEGALLARLRTLPGAAALPVAGAFDLHATFTPRMAQLADALVGYRENPHVDGHETGRRAAMLLARCLREGRRPRQVLRTLPIVWPPTGTGTADDPMRSLERAARRIEAALPGVLAVNVVAGFAFADAAAAGVALSAVVLDDLPAAEEALDELAVLAWDLRGQGLPQEEDPDAVLQRVPPVARGPVLLVEPADNIGGGAPGDCTDLLRALLRHGAPNAGVALNDPAAVRALAAVEPGNTVTLPLGGKGWRGDAGPVTLPATLVSRSDGRFMLEDAQSHLASMAGRHIDMGPSAVVRHAGLTLLLTTCKTPPFDLGQWRSQGVEPTTLGRIVVKAAVAHRRAYDPIAAASFTLRSRGPCASDLSILPYRKLRRPVFPLNAAAQWRPGASPS
jgi:microcystin degradation protein MlrC